MPDVASLRELSSTCQGAELDRIIGTSHLSRPGVTPAQLCWAIAASPIWRDSIKIAKTKAVQHAAPVFLYQLAYKNPTLVPGTGFRINCRAAGNRATHERAVGRFRSPGPSRHDGRAGMVAYTTKKRAAMWLDADSKIVNDLDNSEGLFWKHRA